MRFKSKRVMPKTELMVQTAAERHGGKEKILLCRTRVISTH